ncbi:hypothetical protein K3495_g2237 [Podosphaera aphanis]|nr:hypothetical protein K3495_g2237 [Podosphaera aphanis]
MSTILRHIVSSPRSRNAENNLDLCYVTPQIIATSGPSGRYPQRAYRNPLDQFVKFLDQNHGKNWAIWEFRAEGTGYPDEKVYGRVWHYPWPDHHPPPFRLVPVIIAGMKDWLQENDDEHDGNRKRVVVIHCKAGKGRSGTMACSYLISECGMRREEALAKFTAQRMRPGFGQGVSIPSQLRWVGYADRWAKHGKIYVDRKIEVLEMRIWGLGNGVEVHVKGFIDEGKTIKCFHTFSKKERVLAVNTSGNHNGDKSSDTPQSKAKVPDSKNLKSKSIVVFKPSSRIILPTSDVNIDFRRQSKAGIGLKMVTAVAHVWFNCYFEGQGPEQDSKADESGIFEIEWDKMDGIKGSRKKGIRFLDRLAVLWKVHDPDLKHESD